jgi:hypothetical protein
LETYKIREMNMPFRVQEHIVGFEITVNDPLRVNISERTPQFCNPKSYGLLSEAFS